MVDELKRDCTTPYLLHVFRFRVSSKIECEVIQMRIQFLVVLVFATFVISAPVDAGSRINKYKSKCASYGFKSGTTEFANCVKEFDQNRKSVGDIFRDSLNRFRQDRRRAQQNRIDMLRSYHGRSRTQNCVTRRYGNTERTTCY